MSYHSDLEIAILEHLRNNVGREIMLSYFSKELDENFTGLVYQDKDLQDTLRVLHKEGLVEAIFLKRDESDIMRFSSGKQVTGIKDITKEGLQLLRSYDQRNET